MLRQDHNHGLAGLAVVVAGEALVGADVGGAEAVDLHVWWNKNILCSKTCGVDETVTKVI